MVTGMPEFHKGNKRAVRKLTATQVYDIRLLYRRGDCTQGELARDFGVSVIQIGRITRGEVWQEIKLPPSDRDVEESMRRMLQVQEETQGLSKLQEEGEKVLGPAKNIMNALDEEE